MGNRALTKIKTGLTREFLTSSILNGANRVKMNNFTPEYLEGKLKSALGAQVVHAIDESDGCGAKFSVIVVSEQFRGKTLLQKHKMVNSALSAELKEIHAFSQKTYTPEEWEKAQQS
ncbi:protein BOLA2 [Teleopsis dalmanni]|uniref:protein BOLA2 n=1 Tax=Teleopsis dalmanni TaxID=139649 RepID=UPI0018CE96B9|nr:protein BOLA2 [Teleopsis dalmanni]